MSLRQSMRSRPHPGARSAPRNPAIARDQPGVAYREARQPGVDHKPGAHERQPVDHQVCVRSTAHDERVQVDRWADAVGGVQLERGAGRDRDRQACFRIGAAVCDGDDRVFRRRWHSQPAGNRQADFVGPWRCPGVDLRDSCCVSMVVIGHGEPSTSIVGAAAQIGVRAATEPVAVADSQYLAHPRRCIRGERQPAAHRVDCRVFACRWTSPGSEVADHDLRREQCLLDRVTGWNADRDHHAVVGPRAMDLAIGACGVGLGLLLGR